MAQLVKNLPAPWETWVRPLGWKIPWRRERLPTPVLCPGEVHGPAKSQTWLSDFHFTSFWQYNRSSCTKMTGTQDFDNVIYPLYIQTLLLQSWDICSFCNVNSFDCNPFSFDFSDLWVFFFFFFLQFYCTVTMSDYGSLSICPAWYTLYFLGLWVYAFLQF